MSRREFKRTNPLIYHTLDTLDPLLPACDHHLHFIQILISLVIHWSPTVSVRCSPPIPCCVGKHDHSSHTSCQNIHFVLPLSASLLCYTTTTGDKSAKLEFYSRRTNMIILQGETVGLETVAWWIFIALEGRNLARSSWFVRNSKLLVAWLTKSLG